MYPTAPLYSTCWTQGNDCGIAMARVSPKPVNNILNYVVIWTLTVMFPRSSLSTLIEYRRKTLNTVYVSKPKLSFNSDRIQTQNPQQGVLFPNLICLYSREPGNVSTPCSSLWLWLTWPSCWRCKQHRRTASSVCWDATEKQPTGCLSHSSS